MNKLIKKNLDDGIKDKNMSLENAYKMYENFEKLEQKYNAEEKTKQISEDEMLKKTLFVRSGGRIKT